MGVTAVTSTPISCESVLCMIHRPMPNSTRLTSPVFYQMYSIILLNRHLLGTVCVQRYMCHKLDPLPASRVVTHIRKTMASIIEDFACDGTLPPDITGEIVIKAKKKPITAYDIMKAKEDAESQANDSYQKKRDDARASESGKDREAREKNKIKDQYENYMRLKSKTVNHEDNQKEKEIEGHLDDIKALISTFQNPED
jgi:hypothetical protein